MRLILRQNHHEGRVTIIISNPYTPLIGIIENINKLGPITNVPKDSFHFAMQQYFLKVDALINPYHTGKYINFRSKFADVLLNQPGTHTAKALLRTGVIVNPSFTMASLIHERYFSSINRFAGLLGQSASHRQMDFAAKLQCLQPLLNPECVRIASDLAESVAVTDEPADVIPLPRLDIESIHNNESRKAAVDNYVEAVVDILEQDVPHHVTDWFERVYPIQRLKLWEIMPDKLGAFLSLNKLVAALLTQMVVASDIETLKKYEDVIDILLVAYFFFRCLFASIDKACKEINGKSKK